MKFLPAINLPSGLRTRIKEQIAVGDILKHHWLNFGSYENSGILISSNCIEALELSINGNDSNS